MFDWELTASTQHKDYTGTASFDYDLTADYPAWYHVDGYVTRGMRIGFSQKGQTVYAELLLSPERGDVPDDEKDRLYVKILPDLTFEEFVAPFSSSDIVVMSSGFSRSGTVKVVDLPDDQEEE